MRRSSSPHRTAAPKRSTKPIGQNRKRRVSEFARAYGSKARVQWVKAQRCVLWPCEGASENAHIETGGVSRKADACWIVPMCHEHHLQLHALGRRTFSERYGVELSAEARATEAAWQASQSGLTPLSAIVPGVAASLLGRCEGCS